LQDDAAAMLLGNSAIFFAVSALGLAFSTSSCETHECDISHATYGCTSTDVTPTAPCCRQGEIVLTSAGLVWESTPVRAAWLSFNPNETITLHTEGWTNAPPDPNLSSIEIATGEGPADPFPDGDPPDTPASFTAAAGGSLGAYTIVAPGVIEISNQTCAAEFVRVTIGFDIPDGGLERGPCWQN
jgi:hypothetical protein